MAKRCVTIGIADYPGTGLDLPGAVNDADDWESYLVQQQGCESIGQLRNTTATKKRILKALTDLLRASQPKDLAVIVFSGHGTWVPDLDGDEIDGRDEAWVPYDLQENLILDDELATLFDQHRKPMTRVCLISDSCHSGSMMRNVPPVLSPAILTRRPKFLTPNALSKFANPGQNVQKRLEAANNKRDVHWHAPGIVMLAACADKEYGFDNDFDGRAGGVFTRALLEILPRMPRRATYRDLMQTVKRQLPSPEYPQTPKLSGHKYAQLWPIFADGQSS